MIGTESESKGSDSFFFTSIPKSRYFEKIDDFSRKYAFFSNFSCTYEKKVVILQRFWMIVL